MVFVIKYPATTVYDLSCQGLPAGLVSPHNVLKTPCAGGLAIHCLRLILYWPMRPMRYAQAHVIVRKTKRCSVSRGVEMTAPTIQTQAKHAHSLFICLWVLGFLGSIPPANGQTNLTKYDNTIPAASDTTSSNGRIPVGITGGDTAQILYSAIIKDDSAYKIWYSGYVVSSFRIYYATSPDGLTWTKYDNTIPPDSDTTSTNGRLGLGTVGRGDDLHVYSGTVIKESADSYKMWYTGSTGGT